VPLHQGTSVPISYQPQIICYPTFPMNLTPPVNTLVNEMLTRLERERHVRVLFAIESGSRAWGFASPDSDYDVRFVYVHQRDWYLSVEDGRDVLEVTNGDLDVSGWDLRKALRLMRKSNPALLEWLHSPLVYREDRAFTHELRALARECWRPEKCFQHYFHMARGHWQKYLQGEDVRLKKYLYVLRPLLACRWLEQGRGVVPVLFSTLVNAVLPEQDVRLAVANLLVKKQSSREAQVQPPDAVLHRFVERELARLQPVSVSYGPEPETALEPLNRLFQAVALSA
jgi:uncharacterized protein